MVIDLFFHNKTNFQRQTEREKVNCRRRTNIRRYTHVVSAATANDASGYATNDATSHDEHDESGIKSNVKFS
jgi:hypothetical protein